MAGMPGVTRWVMTDYIRKRIYQMYKRGISLSIIATRMAMRHDDVRNICTNMARQEREEKGPPKHIDDNPPRQGKTPWLDADRCAGFIGCDSRSLPFLVGAPDGDRWGLEQEGNKYRVNKSARNSIVETI